MKTRMTLITILIAGLLLSACASQPAASVAVDASPIFPAFTNGTGKLTFAVQAEAKDQYEIYTLQLEDGKLNQVTDNDIADIAPCWSPDGTKIVYASVVAGVYNLFLVNAEGGKPDQIIGSGADMSEPRWEPAAAGGNRIAYQSNGFGDNNIYILDLSSRQYTMITQADSQETQASWSPDGRKIAYVSNADNDFDIYVMDADGGNSVQLTKNDAYDSNPAWSPDGKQIAFISKRNPDPHFQLYVMNADGSGERQLTSSNYTNHTPAWSPDSRYLAFIADIPDGSRILVLDLSNLELAQITSGFYEYAGLSWVK